MNSKLLTIDFQQGNKKTYSNGVLTLGNSTPSQPWNTTNVRTPWDKIPEKLLQGMNFFFTINPDPNCEWYTTDCDKKVIVTKFLTLIEQLKNRHIINKSISIYEYGQYGAKHGKLHFHGFLKTTDRQTVEKEIAKIFNNRSNIVHRTINTKVIKSVQDRDQMLNYMKKEQQNKIKCLYWN